jgi:hypothetical protein
MAFSRVTVTIPRDVLTAADRRARELGRSRSWVVAEALRAYARTPVVREAAAHPYAAGLGSWRTVQLDADLALTPEARVREAERTAREADLVRGAAPAHRVLQFDRYEDYLDWKNREGRFQ